MLLQSGFRRIFCLFVVLILIFTPLGDVLSIPVKAVVIVDDFVIMTVIVATLIVASGIVLSNPEAYQQAARAFLDSSQDVWDYVSSLVQYYNQQTGLLAIRGVVGFVDFWRNSFLPFFNNLTGAGTILVEGDISRVDFNGNTITTFRPDSFPLNASGNHVISFSSIPDSQILGNKSIEGHTYIYKFGMSSADLWIGRYSKSGYMYWNELSNRAYGGSSFKLVLAEYSYNDQIYIYPYVVGNGEELIIVPQDKFKTYGIAFPLSDLLATTAVAPPISLPYSVPADNIDAGVVIDGVGDMAVDDVISLDLDGTGVTDLVLNPSLDGTGTAAIPTQTDLLRDWDVPLSVPIPPALPDIPDMPDLDNYVLPDVTQLFPFCIPFDLIALFEVLNSEPVVPCFVMPLDFGFVGVNHDLVIDLSDFDGVAAVCRWGSMILFLLGLVLSTRKLIKG